jgi:hypothetical protein
VAVDDDDKDPVGAMAERVFRETMDRVGDDATRTAFVVRMLGAVERLAMELPSSALSISLAAANRRAPPSSAPSRCAPSSETHRSAPREKFRYVAEAGGSATHKLGQPYVEIVTTLTTGLADDALHLSVVTSRRSSRSSSVSKLWFDEHLR